MNRIRKLIFSSRTRALIKSQCQGFCKKKQTCDMIGPIDSASNLRPIKYAIPENETPAEQKLRNYREELQNWNKIFWTNHNLNFIRQKQEFERNELGKKPSDSQALNANEISVFYKKFLDDNWKIHLMYLLEWYKRNSYATFLHLKCVILKPLLKLSILKQFKKR